MMKNFIAALMCLMMFLFLISCDVDNTNDTSTNTNSVNSDKTQAELAMETYKAAINGEICVVDEHLGEIKLKDFRFPSDNLRLDECEILYKAILDMDGDGINEYIIQSEAKDHIVLHYHNGKVYSYCFAGNNFFNLNTDGSFYWIDSYETDNCTRGCNKIAFDRSSSRLKEIYRIKQTSPYDYGDNDHEYYVNGNRIEREDFLDYYDSNCRGKTRATFSPLDISCEFPISSEKAFELASNYWGFKSGAEDGAAGTLYVLKIIILEKPNNDTQSYRIGCQLEGYTNHVIDSCYAQPPMSVTIHKELFVDAITGECREYITQDNDSKKSADYSDVLSIYKLAINACSKGGITAEDMGISDSWEKEIFSDIMYSAYSYHKYEKTVKNSDSLSPIYKLNYGYAQNDLNGDGVDELFLLKEDYTILAVFSYADGDPIRIAGPNKSFPDKFPPLPNCWIDGDGLIHASPGSGFDRYMVYQIANGSETLERIAEYGEILYVGGITKYYKYVGDEKIEITFEEYRELNTQYGNYLGSSGPEVTQKYAGLEYVPLFSEAELIEEIYTSVLKNETKLYEATTNEYKFLKSCKTPSDKIRLSDVADLKYGYADLDGDGIDEPLIDCGDTLILRYYDRKVYAYSFTSSQACNIKTDGTYSCGDLNEGLGYGANKMYFDGAELTSKELWRISNDSEANTEYYIGGKKVSHSEILKYFEDNPKTDIEYLPIDKSWYHRLSYEDAYEIALKYWRIRPDEPDGALGTTIYCKAIIVEVPSKENVYYHILKIFEYYSHTVEGWENNPPYNVSLDKELLIDSTTGECIEIDSKT